jgi:hypothetical protein
MNNGLMKIEKRRKLEVAGWRIGKARDVLDLTAGKAKSVEIKLALARRELGRIVGSAL